MTSTKPEEILVAIRIPATFANAHFYFEKVADRNVWDFPLVNVAAAIMVKNGVIDNAASPAAASARCRAGSRRSSRSSRASRSSEDIAKLAGTVGDARREAARTTTSSRSR